MWPLTVTVALISSPGASVKLTGVDGAGTISYQALSTARPKASQSASVPICSSAGEVELKPPIPTQ